MNVHVLQHVPFEDTGSIASWLKEQNAQVTYTRFFENQILPEIDELTLLIVMGGPMSVNDESALPWLRVEKEFIRKAIRRKVPTLGICLGAQLIASALGSRVYRNRHKEIGWYPVVSADLSDTVFRLPERCDVFHWHGETFDLPPGSVLLARSEACEHQAFQIGEHVIGLQFHLEVTPESIRALVDNCRSELVAGPYIQAETELTEPAPSAFIRVNRIMDDLLGYLTGAG